MKTTNTQANVTDSAVFANNLPQMEASTTLDYSIFNVSTAMTGDITSIQNADPRLYLHLRQGIALIPDPEWRIATLKTINTLMGEVDFKTFEGHVLTLDAWALISDWQRNYRGSLTHNLIGGV